MRLSLRTILQLLLLASLVRIGKTQDATAQAGADEPLEKIGVNGVKAPFPTNSVSAEFPDEARHKNRSGLCIVSMIVDAKGLPRNVKVQRCTDSLFAESSLEAAKQYRFEPAKNAEGKPVSVVISVEVNYEIGNVGGLEMPIRYALTSPPGTTTTAPDPGGAYPLTKSIVPPRMDKFSDIGYERAAFSANGIGACDLLLTIDAKGKAGDARVLHCDKAFLEASAAASLLASHYKPGTLNGSPITVRVSVHLELGSRPSEN